MNGYGNAPLPYYGGSMYGGPPSMPQQQQQDPRMADPRFRYLVQHALMPQQVWPFPQPGKSGAPDLPQTGKQKQQQQQQPKAGLGMAGYGMNMLYPGSGAQSMPYGMSPQLLQKMSGSLSDLSWPWNVSSDS